MALARASCVDPLTMCFKISHQEMFFEKKLKVGGFEPLDGAKSSSTHFFISLVLGATKKKMDLSIVQLPCC